MSKSEWRSIYSRRTPTRTWWHQKHKKVPMGDAFHKRPMAPKVAAHASLGDITYGPPPRSQRKGISPTLNACGLSTETLTKSQNKRGCQTRGNSKESKEDSDSEGGKKLQGTVWRRTTAKMTPRMSCHLGRLSKPNRATA